MHPAIHWRWVKMMAVRVVNVIRTRGARMSKGARLNVAVNLVVAISFVLVSVSGIDRSGLWAAMQRWYGT